MAKTNAKKFKKGDNFQPLPTEKKKNGYRYNLVSRSENAAMYSQINEKCPHPENPDTITGYEVFQIKITNPCTLVDKRTNRVYEQPAKEKFPGNEDFGKFAWSFTSLKCAEKKFEEIK